MSPKVGLELEDVGVVVWLLAVLQLLGLLECDLEDLPLTGDSLPDRDLMAFEW